MTQKVTNRQRKYQSYLTAGTTTAYTVTAEWFTLADDFEIIIEPNQNNIAWPVTIDVNGLWAVTIKRNDGTDLQADDLVANVPAKLYYDQSQNLFFLLVSNTIEQAGIPSGTFPDNRYYPATELRWWRTSANPSFFPKWIYDAWWGVYYYACSTVFFWGTQDDLYAIFHILKNDNWTYTIYTSNNFRVQWTWWTETAFITEDSWNIYLTLSASSWVDIWHIYFDTSTDTFVDWWNPSLITNMGICWVLWAVTTVNGEDYTRVDEITWTWLWSALPTTVVIWWDTFWLDYFVARSFEWWPNPFFRQRWITKS